MLLVTIKSKDLNEKSGRNAKGEWKIREQTGWIELNDERRRLAISLKDGAQPFEPGVYEVALTSFFVDTYGALSLGRLQLQPSKGAAVKAA